MIDWQKGDGQRGWRLNIRNNLSKQLALEPWHRSRFQYSKSIPYCIIVVVAIFISHIFTLGVNKLWSGNVLHHNLSSTRKATLVEKSSTSSVGKVTLVEAATYRPYRLCHALFGCTALIPRCNCIDFKQVKFWETLLRTLNLNFLRS